MPNPFILVKVSIFFTLLTHKVSSINLHPHRFRVAKTHIHPTNVNKVYIHPHPYPISFTSHRARSDHSVVNFSLWRFQWHTCSAYMRKKHVPIMCVTIYTRRLKIPDLGSIKDRKVSPRAISGRSRKLPLSLPFFPCFVHASYI